MHSELPHGVKAIHRCDDRHSGTFQNLASQSTNRRLVVRYQDNAFRTPFVLYNGFRPAGGCNSIFRGGEQYAKGGAAPELTLNLQCAVVPPDDSLNRGESEAPPGKLCCEKRVKDPGDRILIHAAAA